MKLCREEYHWEYLFTQKDTWQRNVDEGFEWIKAGEGNKQIYSSPLPRLFIGGNIEKYMI